MRHRLRIDFLQNRQNAQPQLISSIGFLSVCGILSPLQSVFPAIVLDFLSVAEQQGAADILSDGCHTCKPLQSCPSAKPHQNGFRLIPSVVRHGNAAILACRLPKGGIAQKPPRFFLAKPTRLRLRTHVIVLYDTGNPQIGAEAFRKTSVLVCRCSAQAMVDMYRGEGIPCKFLLQAVQNVEQGNGIRAARKPNHKPCALRHHLKLSQCVSYLFPHVRLLLGILFFPENSSFPLLYTIAEKKTTQT